MDDHFQELTAAEDLLAMNLGRFGTILADPPWRFTNRTGKMAPEHRRLLRYSTLSLQEVMELPIPQLALPQSHLYLWVPNALIREGLEVMERWGFTYKTNLVWYKVRKDGGPDGRGVGFYFRNVTELVLFGIRGSIRTLAPGRRRVNIIVSQKREHSRKPDEIYDIIEKCSPAPYLELFARHPRLGWVQWGNEIDEGLALKQGDLDIQVASQQEMCGQTGLVTVGAGKNRSALPMQPQLLETREHCEDEID